MKISHAHKFLAILLSVVLLISCVPMFVSADGFVEENLMQSKLDTTTYQPIVFYPNGLTVGDYSGWRVPDSLITTLTDSNREVHGDMAAISVGDYRWYGFKFALTESSFVGRMDIYGDYADHQMYYNIYASNDPDTLFSNLNKTVIHCDGTKQTVVFNKTVRYFAIVMQNALNAETGSRLKEIEIYSADPTTAFQTVDLTNDVTKLVEAKTVKLAGGIAANDTNTLTFTKENVSYNVLTNYSNTHKDWSSISSSYNYGIQFTFDASYYIGRVDIDAGIYNADNTYDETWTVYASNDLSRLYDSSSVVADNLVCTKAMGIQLKANVFAKYIAIINTQNNGIRTRGFRIYTADDTGVVRPFESQNVLRTAVDSSTGILMNTSSLAVSDYNAQCFTDAKIATATDGDNVTTVDVQGALDWGPSRYVGAKFTLETETIVGTAKIYSGSSVLPETWRVYASDSLSNLYAPQNLLGEKTCAGSAVEFTVNKSVSYIVFVCTNYDGNMRVAEFEAWSAESVVGFVSENALESHIASSKGVMLNIDSGTVQDSAVFDTHGVLAYAVDGDTSNHHDISEPYSEPTRCFGGEYTLDDYYYIGNAVIYTGFDAVTDTIRIYASASIEDLYTSANMITSSLVCGDLPQTVAINKYIKYFAVVYESYGRAKEYQLWTAAAPEGVEKPFASENVLRTGLASSKAVKMFESGNVADSTVFNNNGALAASVDGNTADHCDVSDPYSEPVQIFGAEYTLDDEYYIGNAVIYTSIANLPDTIRVYASDSLGTLYNSANLIADNLVCSTEPVVLEINKNVTCFAVFYLSYGRVREFELWTADPNAAAPSSPSSLKVLTIGNSFAENASIYASEIAYANGKNLTFGYLKSPSCTIEAHYNAAVNDIAGFKFRVTAPDGTETVIKDGDGVSVAAPNAENGATIDEALVYTDWDVIVFQQESSSARSYETFAYLDELIDYVAEACPDAKFMFHQVWRWGEWGTSDFANIKANAERAGRENNLELIPSGLAFEYARELKDSATYPNDNDGHWQHANIYGQYLAGVAYVDALFGIECSASTFAAHPYVNKNGDVAQLTACANKAARYYKSYGDIDFDGEINAEDLASLVNHLIGRNVDDFDMTLADVNNDGYINVVDIVSLKKILVALDEAE